MGYFVFFFILSYAFVLAGFIENAFLMTLIISTISLGVVVPTLKEEKLMQTNIGQIILLVAVIADLVTMIFTCCVFLHLWRWNREHVAPALIICCRHSSLFIWPRI
ncbi:hypothetical protein BsIDN1_21570 [Bacillus safensis]|uniref:Cation/H+ exchanger transmembrane domain-containing protein n=1 Tax=Bacillus safensis TaxID=561879 RepID=A0A5S9M9B4_BACIA|nr:hypothetical protein BsIDN1_21570 [Bacillus safensis]